MVLLILFLTFSGQLLQGDVLVEERGIVGELEKYIGRILILFDRVSNRLEIC